MAAHGEQGLTIASSPKPHATRRARICAVRLRDVGMPVDLIDTHRRLQPNLTLNEICCRRALFGIPWLFALMPKTPDAAMAHL